MKDQGYTDRQKLINDVVALRAQYSKEQRRNDIRGTLKASVVLLGKVALFALAVIILYGLVVLASLL